jgi:hypothetical protein
MTRRRSTPKRKGQLTSLGALLFLPLIVAPPIEAIHSCTSPGPPSNSGSLETTYPIVHVLQCPSFTERLPDHRAADLRSTAVNSACVPTGPGAVPSTWARPGVRLDPDPGRVGHPESHIATVPAEAATNLAPRLIP